MLRLRLIAAFHRLLCVGVILQAMGCTRTTVAAPAPAPAPVMEPTTPEPPADVIHIDPELDPTQDDEPHFPKYELPEITEYDPQELQEPIYPFQQYVQVRQSYSVQHLPSPTQEIVYHESPDGDGDGYSASSSGDGGRGYDYNPGTLREEISDYRKQEVYEEKGFKDSAYDHNNYWDGGQNHLPMYPEGSASVHNPRQAAAMTRLHSRLHTPDGSSSNILKYAESNLYDQDAHQMGIYAARAGIYCPEVIDFSLDPEHESGTLHSKKNPKLQGLGGKIECLKTKYFGPEPLSSAIFLQPAESKQSLIKFGSMDDFMKEVHQNVHQNINSGSSGFPSWGAVGGGGGSNQFGFMN